MDSFNTFQTHTRTTGVYPSKEIPGAAPALSYLTLGLTGEAGEVSEHIADLTRDNNGALDADRRALLIKEVGDVSWYLTELTYHLYMNLSELADGDSIAAFQASAPGVEVYPGRDQVGSPAALSWLGHTLTASTGAVADQVKKVLRDDDGVLLLGRQEIIVPHLRRALWALSELSRHLQEPYGQVLAGNVEKLRDRKARGVLQGSGDTR